MKGSASNMGAIQLAKKAWQLEKAAAEKKLNNAAGLFSAVEKDYLAVKDFLEHPDWMLQAKQQIPPRSS